MYVDHMHSFSIPKVKFPFNSNFILNITIGVVTTANSLYGSNDAT